MAVSVRFWGSRPGPLERSGAVLGLYGDRNSLGLTNSAQPTTPLQDPTCRVHRSRVRPARQYDSRAGSNRVGLPRAGAKTTRRKDDGRLRASLIQRDKSNLGLAGLAVPLDFPTNLKTKLKNARGTMLWKKRIAEWWDRCLQDETCVDLFGYILIPAAIVGFLAWVAVCLGLVKFT